MAEANGKTATPNGANLGFEADLFSAADKLRKNLEPSDYKHVVLGLRRFASACWAHASRRRFGYFVREIAMDEGRIEIRAVKCAEKFYRTLGWRVENVSRVRGGHSGYDLFLEKEGERLMVEVKGCSRLYQIPDLYATEIDRDTMRLIADELCVVYFVGTDVPQVARIPREALQPDHIIPKYGYRISGRFKNERTIKPFIVPAP